MKQLRIHTCIILIAVLLCLSSAPGIAHGQQTDQTADEIDITLIQEEQPPLAPLQSLTAEGAVVVEQHTGKVLYGKQEQKRLYPASTTKILTALIAAEYGNLDETVVVGEEINLATWDGSKAGLEETEEITLRNLVYGLLINSGNDAANTIAVHIARKTSGKNLPTQEALDYFAQIMNKRARQAGALHSNFVNAHGYHDPQHYTTAYDLAMIGREALKNEFFREAISVTAMNNTYWVSGEPRFWRSKNRLLNTKDAEYYEWATGGKTGYTSAAGQCLVTFATKNGLDLIGVVMKSVAGTQWGETKELLEYGFSNYEYRVVLKQGEIIETLPVDNYAADDWGSLAVQIASQDWADVFRKDEIEEIQQEIIWDSSVLSENATRELPRLAAPISKEQKVGELKVTLQGQVLTSVPLTAVREVKGKPIFGARANLPGKGTPARLGWPTLVALLLLALLLVRIAIYFIQRKRRSHYTMYRRY